jgi:nucleoside-diphosphate-sugar epimerase
MPRLITSEAELEEALSRPSAADVAAAKVLDGNLLILGAGGKMGPSLARLAKRASEEAGCERRVVAVARFSNPSVKEELLADGIETITADLLDKEALRDLPDAPNAIFMAARKFGTTGAEHLTWALNTYLPALIADRFRSSQIVAFSTGNVYPLTPISNGGASEYEGTAPIGEYAQSALGRERMFQFASDRWGTKVVILRLNYAVALRYGVLSDIGRAVYERRPVDVSMGAVNVIWQRDANSVALRSLAYCQSPPLILNVTGSETLSIRAIAQEFGTRLKIDPIFFGIEGESALLSNAARCHQMFGHPTVGVPQLIDWTAHWISNGGSFLNKPTHFEVMDGKF